VTIPAKVPPGIVDKLKHEKDSEFGLPPMVARAPFFFQSMVWGAPLHGHRRASDVLITCLAQGTPLSRLACSRPAATGCLCSGRLSDALPARESRQARHRPSCSGFQWICSSDVPGAANAAAIFTTADDDLEPSVH
jgi:hypothetical protein